jgi:hypothetical protein
MMWSSFANTTRTGLSGIGLLRERAEHDAFGTSLPVDKPPDSLTWVGRAYPEFGIGMCIAPCHDAGGLGCGPGVDPDDCGPAIDWAYPHMTVSDHPLPWRLLLVDDDEGNFRLVRELLRQGLPGTTIDRVTTLSDACREAVASD